MGRLTAAIISLVGLLGPALGKARNSAQYFVQNSGERAGRFGGYFAATAQNAGQGVRDEGGYQRRIAAAVSLLVTQFPVVRPDQIGAIFRGLVVGAPNVAASVAQDAPNRNGCGTNSSSAVPAAISRPDPAKNSARRFFLNLDAPVILANDPLQGDFRDAGVTVGRFGINSTMGVLGLFDPVASFGLERHHADFGQTLHGYNVGTNPCLVSPIRTGPGVVLLLAVSTACR